MRADKAAKKEWNDRANEERRGQMLVGVPDSTADSGDLHWTLIHEKPHAAGDERVQAMLTARLDDGTEACLLMRDKVRAGAPVCCCRGERAAGCVWVES